AKALDAAERENLWFRAITALNDAVAKGLDEAKAKRDLARWFFEHDLQMSKSRTAFVRNLERKAKRAEEGTIKDGRLEANQAKRAPTLSETDRNTLFKSALASGDIDPAWADCLTNKKLSAEILARYPLPKGKRPRCPKAIRRQIQAEIKRSHVWHHKPRYARLN